MGEEDFVIRLFLILKTSLEITIAGPYCCLVQLEWKYGSESSNFPDRFTCYFWLTDLELYEAHEALSEAFIVGRPNMNPV